MIKTIEIRPTQFKTIPWSELKTYEFNTLKESKDRDVSKLKTSILENKFSDSFDIWDKFVIDGSGRKAALTELQKEGYEIPDLPCNFIEAQNLKEAKKIVLLKNSSYGKISQASLADFASLDFEIEELKELAESQLSLGALDFMIESLEATEIDYSDKNKEVSLDSLGDESSLSFKFDHKTYLEALDLLNNAKESLGLDTNEETLIKLLLEYA